VRRVRQWLLDRKLRKLGQEQLVIKVWVSGELLDHGVDESTAQIIGNEAFERAYVTTMVRMARVSPRD